MTESQPLTGGANEGPSHNLTALLDTATELLLERGQLEKALLLLAEIENMSPGSSDETVIATKENLKNYAREQSVSGHLLDTIIASAQSGLRMGLGEQKIKESIVADLGDVTGANKAIISKTTVSEVANQEEPPIFSTQIADNPFGTVYVSSIDVLTNKPEPTDFDDILPSDVEEVLKKEASEKTFARMSTGEYDPELGYLKEIIDEGVKPKAKTALGPRPMPRPEPTPRPIVNNQPRPFLVPNEVRVEKRPWSRVVGRVARAATLVGALLGLSNHRNDIHAQQETSEPPIKKITPNIPKEDAKIAPTISEQVDPITMADELDDLSILESIPSQESETALEHEQIIGKDDSIYRALRRILGDDSKHITKVLSNSKVLLNGNPTPLRDISIIHPGDTLIYDSATDSVSLKNTSGLEFGVKPISTLDDINPEDLEIDLVNDTFLRKGR